MTDLTDSYCERCGARYVFSPPAPKTMSLKGARVLAKGLKNFVMTDGQSMTDSLTLARHEDSHQDSTRITEAFHKTFNFCMTCRQYACEKCWNIRAGACLSCSPEEGFEPVAREDHLLVRTPVARWDMDWSLFPDGPDAEPVNKAAPLPFDAPIQFSDSVPAQPVETTAPEAWPVADHLPAPDPGRINGRGDSAAHRASGHPVDPMAASLWPIADELAPEMTLTPEELDLVETRLSHGEVRPEDAQAVEMAAAQSAAELAPAMEATPEPEPTSTLQPGRAPDFAPGPAFAPVPEPAPQFYPVTAPSPVWPAAPQVPTAPQLEAAPQLLTPPVLPAIPQTPVSLTWTSAGHTQASATPWPRATAWSERPVEAQDWRTDRPAPPEQPEPLPAASAAAPSMALPAPDARSAAAMRLSAVPVDEGDAGQFLPAPPDVLPAQTPAAVPVPAAAAELASTPVPAESSPWLSALDRQHQDPPPPHQPQLFNVPASQPPQPHASGPDAIGRRTPAAPWQPLGSSWPAAQDPRAPWPGPQVTAALPAVAAQQGNASTVTAMWAQSSQEVLNHGTVRVCHRCALPVSTHARFCRRCGTQQT